MVPSGTTLSEFSSTIQWDKAVESVSDRRLEETRTRFVQALQDLEQTSDADTWGQLCEGQGLLPLEERDCATFVRSVAVSMARLHTGPRRVPFELSKDPVYVTGPDGAPMRVAARTLTGPEGSVTFDYGLILRRSPKLLLALLAHETGHKVEFRYGSPDAPRLYVEDDAPVLSYASGRALLDAAGLAIANYAERRGVIGSEFSVRDKFYCEIKPTGGGLGFFQAGDDVREFINASDERPYDAFRTGIGPARKVQVGVIQGATCLSLRLMLHETSSCLDEGDPAGRFVDLSVYRVYRPEPDRPTPAPELLGSKRIHGWNPACERESNARERPMVIEVDQVVFSCTYKGMAAAAHAQEKDLRLAADGCPGA